MKNTRKFIIASFLLLAIDLIWIMLVMGPIFKNMVCKIQKSPMKINILGALMSYIFLIIGTFYFGILKLPDNANFGDSMINAGIFGLIAYGIFDFTNLAVFNDYSLSVSIMDSLWGAILCTMVSYFTIKIDGLIQK